MKKVLLGFAVLVALSLVIALIADSRSTGMFLINTALKARGSIDVQQDISYGTQPWQSLDVYQARNSASPSPVLVFFHGGGWSWGNKNLYYFVADTFVKLGYVVVLPDYVKYPQGRFPSFVEDGAKTLAWVKGNIAKFGGDPTRIFISGHSAGAHTAALLVTDKTYLHKVGLSAKDIKGFAGISGPYNFTPKWPQYIETFGSENFDKMKAMTHVDGSESPTLLIHSKGDTAVGLFNQETLHKTMKEHHVLVESILYGEHIHHINIMLKLHPWFADEVNVGKDIDRFFKQID